MNVCLDASVIVPLFARDSSTDRAGQYLRVARPAVIVSDFASAEFASAIARKVRTEHLSHEESRAAFATFDIWVAAEAMRVQAAAADISTAESFIRRLDLNLRAPDAIHIAIALRLDAALATFDERMADCARLLGCGVVDF